MSLTLTSSVYICQVPNLTNYQLQTLGYQQLVDKKLVVHKNVKRLASSVSETNDGKCFIHPAFILLRW